MYRKTVLDNGLTVMTAHMPGVESISVGVWIRNGGRYEPKSKTGISHFLEHMLFKGTKRYTTQEVKESIEGLGGMLNGFTGSEATCYVVKILKEHLSLVIDILSDMVLYPKLAASDIEKERNVILEEIKMYMDQPSHYVHDLLQELLWPGQALGRSLVGSFETVSKIARHDLVEYKNKFHSAANIVVAIAGNVDDDKLHGEINKYFGRLNRKPGSHFHAADSRQKRARLNIQFKETEQAHLALGFHSVSRFHDDRYKIGCLHIILGANMSSRLFHEVRERRGLAYEISSSLKEYHDTGSFTISAGVDNKKIGQTIRIIMKELEKIKTRPVSDDELGRAKEYYRGQLLLALEESMNHMLWVGEKVTAGDEAYRVGEILKSVELVTKEDLTAAARKIFQKSNLNLAIIGPLKDKATRKIKEYIV